VSGCVVYSHPTRRSADLGLGLALPLAVVQAAISDGEIRIGLITDMTSVYRDVGLGAEVAAEMAIEDFGGKINGKPIRLYVRDHRDRKSTRLNSSHVKISY